MALDTWLLFLAASIGISLTPGPTGLLALTHGALHGSRRTLFTIAGGVLGFVAVKLPTEYALARTAHRIRPWLARVGRRFNRVCGGLFVAVGAALPLRT